MNKTYRVLSRAYCSSAQHLDRKTIAKNNLFNKLFPTPTLINPVLQPIYSVEPIDPTSNNRGTLFTDRLDSPSPSPSPSSQTNTENTYNNEIQDTIDSLKKSSQSRFFNNNNNIHFEENDQEEDIELSTHFKQPKTTINSNNNKLNNKSRIEKTTLPKYHKHVEINSKKSHFINILVQSTRDISLDSIENVIRKEMDFPIGSMVLENIYDNALGGQTISTFVSILPNDVNINPEDYYKRFSIFGFTINGIRLKILNANHLKTIMIRGLDKNMSEEQLRNIFTEHFDVRSKDKNFLKMSFPQTTNSPHQLQQQKHQGHCHITLPDHLTAIRALRFSSSLNLDEKMLNICWSRYIFSEGTAAAHLISSLERKKSKQLHEIELMKDMIDLKAKVKELEAKLLEKESKKTIKKQLIV